MSHVSCSRCRTDNPAGAKFCLECGAPLKARCEHCGAALSRAAKLCSQCSQPVRRTTGASSRFASHDSYTPRHLAEKILTSQTALEGERKQVTVLFADLGSSMELVADRDPEEARELLDDLHMDYTAVGQTTHLANCEEGGRGAGGGRDDGFRPAGGGAHGVGGTDGSRSGRRGGAAPSARLDGADAPRVRP